MHAFSSPIFPYHPPSAHSSKRSDLIIIKTNIRRLKSSTPFQQQDLENVCQAFTRLSKVDQDSYQNPIRTLIDEHKALMRPRSRKKLIDLITPSPVQQPLRRPNRHKDSQCAFLSNPCHNMIQTTVTWLQDAYLHYSHYEPAAKRIQPLLRGHLARIQLIALKQAHSQEQLALLLQPLFRGHLARTQLIRLKRTHSQRRLASLLQPLFRVHLAKRQLMHLKENRAAMLIQSVYHGHLARVRFHDLKPTNSLVINPTQSLPLSSKLSADAKVFTPTSQPSHPFQLPLIHHPPAPLLSLITNTHRLLNEFPSLCDDLNWLKSIAMTNGFMGMLLHGSALTHPVLPGTQRDLDIIFPPFPRKDPLSMDSIHALFTNIPAYKQPTFEPLPNRLRVTYYPIPDQMPTFTLDISVFLTPDPSHYYRFEPYSYGIYYSSSLPLLHLEGLFQNREPYIPKKHLSMWRNQSFDISKVRLKALGVSAPHCILTLLLKEQHPFFSDSSGWSSLIKDKALQVNYYELLRIITTLSNHLQMSELPLKSSPHLIDFLSALLSLQSSPQAVLSTDTQFTDSLKKLWPLLKSQIQQIQNRDITYTGPSFFSGATSATSNAYLPPTTKAIMVNHPLPHSPQRPAQAAPPRPTAPSTPPRRPAWVATAQSKGNPQSPPGAAQNAVPPHSLSIT
ncbi:MAG: hypothetical protein CL521_05850 [Actinobacteria bacterium]|nr:hypothetical protein [Actinomycetota bacterium]